MIGLASLRCKVENAAMFADPVIAEIRRTGARIAEECGGDLHKLIEYFQKKEAQHPERIVRRPIADELGAPTKTQPHG